MIFKFCFNFILKLKFNPFEKKNLNANKDKDKDKSKIEKN